MPLVQGVTLAHAAASAVGVSAADKVIHMSGVGQYYGARNTTNRRYDFNHNITDNLHKTMVVLTKVLIELKSMKKSEDTRDIDDEIINLYKLFAHETRWDILDKRMKVETSNANIVDLVAKVLGRFDPPPPSPPPNIQEERGAESDQDILNHDQQVDAAKKRTFERQKKRGAESRDRGSAPSGGHLKVYNDKVSGMGGGGKRTKKIISKRRKYKRKKKTTKKKSTKRKNI
jgi:hypothetical protein